MKYAIPLTIVGALGVTGYFIFNPGAEALKSPPSVISADHPFFNPKKVDVPHGVEKLKYGQELFAGGRYDDAVGIFGSVYSSADLRPTKATTLLMAGQVLMQKNEPTSRQHARELFELYLSQFEKEGTLDTVHYNLGLIALEDIDAPRALFHFTTVLEDFPNSTFAPNAAFYARYLASVLRQQNQTLKGKLLQTLAPILPRNPAALVGLLSSLVGVFIWLAHDWKTYYQRLIQKKDPLLWTLLVSLVLLAAANYLFENQANARSMLEATKLLPALGR